jgi:DNA-directed RNA polymerase specialized sigma24 family protein
MCLRDRLRMLGSVSEAEDIVQEALVRVHQAIERGEEISSPRAYAATITTRDVAVSA